MSYWVEFKQKAVTDLDSLTKIFQERILKKIKWLSENFNEITPQALSANLTGLFKQPCAIELIRFLSHPVLPLLKRV